MVHWSLVHKRALELSGLYISAFAQTPNRSFNILEKPGSLYTKSCVSHHGCFYAPHLRAYKQRVQSEKDGNMTLEWFNIPSFAGTSGELASRQGPDSQLSCVRPTSLATSC